jgi:ribonuclease HI
MHLEIITDGEAKPNPGKMGIGVLIRDSEGTVMAAISEKAGVGSNNVAEYLAVIRGLEEAKSLGAQTVTLYTDSQLVDRQLRGVYRVKSKGLKPLHQRALDRVRNLNQVRFRWHPRESPKAKWADALAEGGPRAAKVLEDLCQNTSKR